MAPVPATGFATTTGSGPGAGGGAAGTAGRMFAGGAPAELEGTSKDTWPPVPVPMPVPVPVPGSAGALVCPAERNRFWAATAARGSGSQQCHGS